MSKAFVKEDQEEDENPPELPVVNSKNYVTPNGFALLQQELQQLVSKERPSVVEVVRWAAGNGDRSENGDYIYGKKRLREIDRRIRYLRKQIKNAEVVNPANQQTLKQVFFGSTVKYRKKDGQLETVKIVGIDEADISKRTISWVSPLAKALHKSSVGDEVTFVSPSGSELLEVVEIFYK